jgi:hypothetical protein
MTRPAWNSVLRASLLWVLNNRGSEMIVEGYCS